MGFSACSSNELVRSRIRSNLERAAKKYGWSECYVDLVLELLTCGDTDASQHEELLEAIQAERSRMTRS